MKAIKFTEYGPPEVLQLEEIEKPVPNENEVLIKIYSTSVGFGDLLTRNFKNNKQDFNMPSIFRPIVRLSFGFIKPKEAIQILGSDFSGEIEAIGEEVSKFSVGDQVFGSRGQNFGAYAEYLCMSENGLIALKPSNMSFEEASTIPYGALTALNLLQKIEIKDGQKVLVNGASGGIGSIAVQLLKSYGAEVTGVCGKLRVEYVKKLGADHVIDYSNEDFTTNEEKYDLIFDILGKTSFSTAKNSLNPNGTLLLASFKMKQVFQMLWTKIRGNKKLKCAIASYSSSDLNLIKELIEEGKIKAFIDKQFSLEEAAKAHKYVEEGNRKANVIITTESTDMFNV